MSYCIYRQHWFKKLYNISSKLLFISIISSPHNNAGNSKRAKVPSFLKGKLGHIRLIFCLFHRKKLKFFLFFALLVAATRLDIHLKGISFTRVQQQTCVLKSWLSYPRLTLPIRFGISMTTNWNKCASQYNVILYQCLC